MVETRVAASYVQLLYEYLRNQGLDAARLLGPMPAADVHFVSMAVWKDLLAKVASLDRRPGLGLRIAEHISPRHFGVVGHAALACNTLADALVRLERFHASVYDVNLAQVTMGEDAVCIEWGVERGKPGALVDETAIASLVQLARDMTGRYWPAREVSFVNPLPLDVTPYQDYFGGLVRFAQPVTRLVIDAEYLSLPLRKSDPAMLAELDQQAQSLLARVSAVPALVDVWRCSLISMIREGQASLPALARTHHTSPRSLQRRLAEHGLSFQKLLDETRHQLAKSYLLDTSLDLAEMALLLGYSEQSAFTRAFRHWTGMAPAQWRKQQATHAMTAHAE